MQVALLSRGSWVFFWKTLGCYYRHGSMSVHSTDMESEGPHVPHPVRVGSTPLAEDGKESQGKTARHSLHPLTWPSVCCVGGSTRPGSLWPHPLPLTGWSLHPKTPRAELADLAHPLFVNCIGYSMAVMHKHWSGVGKRARLKVPFALKELTPCPHHHLMN